MESELRGRGVHNRDFLGGRQTTVAALAAIAYVTNRMNSANAICIAVDGLRANALGAFGNTSQPTPNCDRLAGQSLVVEWMWNVFPDKDHAYQQLWHLPADDDSTDALLHTQACNLPAAVTQAGGAVSLITDDPQLAEQSQLLPLDQLELVEPEASSTQLAADSSADTAMARLFATAALHVPHWAQTAATSRPSLLWIDAQGFAGPWDAPAEFRERIRDEQDPFAPTWVVPPSGVPLIDPDEQLAHRLAYAAQMAVLDECCGALVDTIDALKMSQPLLIALVGKRGYPLGEHSVGGWGEDSLYSELLHIPCLLRTPRDETLPTRCARLATLSDLPTTLLHWMIGKTPDRPAAAIADREPQDLLQVASLSTRRQDSAHFAVRAGNARGERVVKVQDWMLVVPCDSAPQLFAKPDDRWEFNDVASRCPAAMDCLLPLGADLSAPLGAFSLEKAAVEQLASC